MRKKDAGAMPLCAWPLTVTVALLHQPGIRNTNGNATELLADNCQPHLFFKWIAGVLGDLNLLATAHCVHDGRAVGEQCQSAVAPSPPMNSGHTSASPCES